MPSATPNEWGLVIHSTADGTRPIAAMGTSITPTQNNFGTAAYSTLISGANLTDDCWELEVCVNTVGISATSRDCLVRIGLDPAGGTSFTELVTLVCGPASTYLVVSGLLAGGVRFRFPIRIKAGTSIGAAATVNSATLTAINAFCTVKCRPSHPWAVYAGTYIDAFGVTTASSSGTAITPGTASEGTFTQIGSALTRPVFALEYGHGIANATGQNGTLHDDIAGGDALNKKVIIPNHPVFNSANEVIAKPVALTYCRLAVGDLLYARSQAGGTLETGHSIAIYGIGG